METTVEVEVKKQYRLPKEFAIKWVEALKSGRYQQGGGMLKRRTILNEFQYCCLGVAGELAGCTNMEVKGCFVINHENKPANFTEEELTALPKELHGSSVNNPLVGKCVSMNDEQGMSFIKIADWIEENVDFYEEG